MWMAQFSAHAARGLIREQRSRRTIMFVVLALALALVFAGSTFLQATVNPQEHLIWFTLFWFGCAWLTLLALLLALYDLLMVRAETRARREALRRQFRAGKSPGSLDAE